MRTEVKRAGRGGGCKSGASFSQSGLKLLPFSLHTCLIKTGD